MAKPWLFWLQHQARGRSHGPGQSSVAETTLPSCGRKFCLPPKPPQEGQEEPFSALQVGVGQSWGDPACRRLTDQQDTVYIHWVIQPMTASDLPHTRVPTQSANNQCAIFQNQVVMRGMLVITTQGAKRQLK